MPRNSKPGVTEKTNKTEPIPPEKIRQKTTRGSLESIEMRKSASMLFSL